MAWKKYFKDANLSPLSGEKVPNFAKRNYSSYLPDVCTGHPNRIQRYFQYDQMDSDSEINAALDILAEFSTQQNKENETPFDIVFKDETTEHEVKLLKKWYNLFIMPSSYKIMNKIYRNINSITTKKIYINYFNKVSNSLYQYRIRTYTKVDFISISTQRQKFIDQIKDEKNKRKFVNITKKLDYPIF